MEIMFRGKDVESGKWLYGWVFGEKTKSIIELDTQYVSKEVVEAYCTSVVIPETIGQYIGDDKNGVKIFGGDICRYYNPEDKDGICEIKEDYALWISGTIKDTNLMTSLFYLKCSSDWEVIGNIHDNPELMEVTE